MNESDTSKVRSLRRMQLILTVLFALLAVLAMIVPMWIEEMLRVSPDGGSGEFELLLAVPFGIAAIVLGALTWRTGRRLQVSLK